METFVVTSIEKEMNGIKVTLEKAELEERFIRGYYSRTDGKNSDYDFLSETDYNEFLEEMKSI